MGLFSKKKREVEGNGCCCGGNCNADTMAEAEKAKTAGCSVKVLGSGCAKDRKSTRLNSSH